MKPIKCQLILHGSFRQFDMGEFPSISAAREYGKRNWRGPYTIKKLENEKQESK